jgi:hypothetical protein
LILYNDPGWSPGHEFVFVCLSYNYFHIFIYTQLEFLKHFHHVIVKFSNVSCCCCLFTDNMYKGSSSSYNFFCLLYVCWSRPRAFAARFRAIFRGNFLRNSPVACGLLYETVSTFSDYTNLWKFSNFFPVHQRAKEICDELLAFFACKLTSPLRSIVAGSFTKFQICMGF